MFMNDKLRYTELLDKYLSGNILPEELTELFGLTVKEGMDETLAGRIREDWLFDASSEQPALPKEQAEKIALHILASEESANQLFVETGRRTRLLYQRLAVAATVLIVILTGVYLSTRKAQKGIDTSLEAYIPKNSLRRLNETKEPMMVVLEDGSKVILQPNSSLSYPGRFIADKREVYLTGEAFFEVAKNPNKPFLVYYNNIVTRVLGTSFSIKTNKSTQHVEVSVKTGRVQVSENDLLTKERRSSGTARSVILVPNQKTMYDPTHHDFEVTLADTIYSLSHTEDAGRYARTATSKEYSFVYENATNLKRIFSQLEEVYGIEIVVENENIYNCVFTGDISTQGMLRKLHIICLTIGASYDVKGTKVLVSGKGCQ